MFFTHVANLNSAYRPPRGRDPKVKKLRLEKLGEPSLELSEIYQEVTVPYR